jgi:signal transduction histidine kinase/CheY-like chemotaxis protein
MSAAGEGLQGPEDFELLARLTAQLASTASLDDIVDTVLSQIVALGFGAVWMAVLDERTGHLVTLKEVIDGVDTTHEMPKIFMLDMRQPIGHGFREHRMINVSDPDSLHIIERDDDVVPPDTLALPRVIYEHLRGHPFACGPLLGSRGQSVGALGLSSYRGRRPIPQELLGHGLLRALQDHLGIAMERALHLERLERLNSELVKAQAAIAADARIKAVGELASAVAHDLKNLCGIALMAVSVGERSPTHAAEALPRIARANSAIGELVGRLQRAARTSPSKFESSDLRQIVDDVVVMLHPVLREHSIDLELDLPPISRVRCDPSLARQVVLNLVINAQDSLSEVPEDRRRLSLTARQEGDIVRLTVVDTGAGIAPDVLGKLFQPFVTSKGGSHLGLGLAAAQASLKHFGGRLEGKNVPGRGAVFEMTLFVAAADPDDELVPARHQPAQRHSISVLAVDDDPDIVELVRTYLEPLGFQVVTSLSADDALSTAQQTEFDLVLCDVGLPKRSGLDVCTDLRERGYRGKLVLMTGWDTDALSYDRRAANCDSMIAKPFIGRDLLHLIERLLTT